MPSKVAVIGNCQTMSIVDCLEALSPQTKFKRFASNALNTEKLRVASLKSLKQHDLILSQNLTHERFGTFARDALAKEFPNVIFFPQIMFGGFHPDDCTLKFEGQFLQSPLGDHHSLLVIAAFKAGIRPARVAKLFNAYIFARLNYFDEYELAKSVLLSHASGLGFDLSEAVEEWRASGVFMHMPHHPSIAVLSDIAKRVAIKAGIPITGSTAKVPDRLKQGLVMPVYPAIARRFGVSGTTSFKLSRQEARGKDIEMDLDEFVHKSYLTYGGYPGKAFNSARINRASVILKRECI